MSFEDNDNLYVIEEEREKEIDKSPRNFAAYNLENEEEQEEDSEGEELIVSRKSAFGVLFRIMFTPVEGWKTLRRNKFSPESLQSGCFYPLLALLAMSKFVEFFYSVNVTLSEVVTQAVISFVAYFFGYFAIQMVMSWLLGEGLKEKYDTIFGKNYTIMSLSSLVLFSILINLLPMLWPVLIFLPIWSLYFMFKGVKFFHFPEGKEMKFYVMASASFIGVPLLIDWALNSIL